MILKNWYRLLLSQLFHADVACTNTAGTTQTVSVYNGYQFSFGYDYFQCPSIYAPRFLHTTTTFNSAIAANGSSNNAASGVYFGTGATAPSYDDYTLSGDIIHTATASTAVNIADLDNGKAITGKYTITNTGAEEITISEIGLVYAFSTFRILVERTVLDTPVTIPAGGIGLVEYTITFNLPTAAADAEGTETN